MNMEIPTYLLLFLGCLGAADILIYHSISHGIRSHPESAMELVTHSLRGPTYAALFVVIPNFRMQGSMLWALLALFVVDVGVSIWDFSLERRSRQFLGGLPSGEYVLHMLIAMVFGAVVTSVVFKAGPDLHAPTSLVYSPATVPFLVRLLLFAMAVVVLFSGIQDALAAGQMWSRRNQVKPASQVTPQQPWADLPVVKASHWQAWMPPVLVCAGIYNLLWGAWVSAYPSALFHLAGMAPINYPQIWQCVGMIVGVYGVGYLIAATDPLRHWPIVLVGLLGKVLGPVGMLVSILKHDFPISLAWTCVTNDLIWWIPFGLILYRAIPQLSAGEITQKHKNIGVHLRRFLN
jgi:hypothetical protein